MKGINPIHFDAYWYNKYGIVHFVFYGVAGDFFFL